MARPKKTITEKEVELAINERGNIKDWALVQRLSAVIAYEKYSAKEVGRIFNVTGVSVINWAVAFRKFGVDGLRDGIKGHRSRKLSEENAEIVKKWILDNKDSKGNRVHWTLKRLCIEIREVFGIELAYSTLSDSLARMNIVLKRPRPIHYHFDEQKTREFKKNAGNH